MRHGLHIDHPRYPLLPKIGMSTAPLALFAAVLPRLRRQIDAGGDFDLIDAHYFYPDGVAAVLLGWALGRPVVVTARGSDLNLIADHPVPRRWIRWAAARAAGLVTVSSGLRDRLVALGTAPERIRVLRNGVDLALFRPGDREGGAAASRLHPADPARGRQSGGAEAAPADGRGAGAVARRRSGHRRRGVRARGDRSIGARPRRRRSGPPARPNAAAEASGDLRSGRSVAAGLDPRGLAQRVARKHGLRNPGGGLGHCRHHRHRCRAGGWAHRSPRSRRKTLPARSASSSPRRPSAPPPALMPSSSTGRARPTGRSRCFARCAPNTVATRQWRQLIAARPGHRLRHSGRRCAPSIARCR